MRQSWRGAPKASAVPTALAKAATALRQRLADAVVECGMAPCRRFHFDHAWLRRAPGIYLGGRWYCSSACFRDAVEREVRGQSALRFEGGRRPPRMPWRLILLTRGEVTEAQLAQARAELMTRRLRERGSMTRPSAPAASAGEGRLQDDLGAALVRLGYASEKQVTEARAAEAGCSVYPGGGTGPHPAPRHAQQLLPPSALLDQHHAVVVHLDRRGGRLVLGWVLRQEPALLQAVAEITGLRTEGCFVTPSEYARLLATGASQAAGAACYDTGAEVADDPVVITELIVDQAVRSAAEQVHLARLGDRLWLRLSGRPGTGILKNGVEQLGSQATSQAADCTTRRVSDRIFALRPQLSAAAARATEHSPAAPSLRSRHPGSGLSAAAEGRPARFTGSGRKLQPL